jgi:hypothetical protein
MNIIYNRNESTFIGDITIMYIECFARSFPKKLPNPETD